MRIIDYGFKWFFIHTSYLLKGIPTSELNTNLIHRLIKEWEMIYLVSRRKNSLAIWKIEFIYIYIFQLSTGTYLLFRIGGHIISTSLYWNSVISNLLYLCVFQKVKFYSLTLILQPISIIVSVPVGFSFNVLVIKFTLCNKINVQTLGGDNERYFRES